jgi:magnesium transporter
MTQKNFNNFEYIYTEQINSQLLEILHKKVNISELDLEDVLSDTQLSKLERNKNYLYLALQFPELHKTTRDVFVERDIHCFLASDFIVIINKENLEYLKEFNQQKNEILNYDHNPYNVFYEMLDFCTKKAYRKIVYFKNQISELEKDIFNFGNNPRDAKDLIRDILNNKRNIINCLSIMLPLKEVIVEMSSKQTSVIDKNGLEELDDTLDKLKKIINNLINYKEQMNLLAETNEAMIARNTNEVIKVLTVISLIVLIPTIITGFFGMNIWIGWDPSVPNYVQLIAITLSILISTILAFIWMKKKKWV